MSYRIIKETNSHNEQYYVIQKRYTFFYWDCGYSGDTALTYEIPTHYSTLEEAEKRLQVLTTPYKRDIVK
jgi:hypothetical protein